MSYQKPKGTADILPNESKKWQFVETKAREIFSNYQFQEIRTPIFESYDVFSRSSGDTSDIVSKEMYDFKDKGDRHIALRPEGTAGVVRAYVENKLFGPEFQKPYKVYYMGPMFRYERPQSGRQRQFHQIGVEAFGAENPALDAEIINMAMTLLKAYQIEDLKLVINTLGDQETRAAYHEALVNYLRPHFDALSEDSKIRLDKNPLRILDSKDQNDQKIVADAPNILDYLSEASKKHFEIVQNLLTTLGVTYTIDANMVRGLDYYNHTIFEVMTNHPILGQGDTTILAGGRYNGLAEQLGGPNTPGFGFGLGVERLILLMTANQVDFKDEANLDAYIVGIGDETNQISLQLTEKLRAQGLSVERDYLNRKPKAQFKTANKMQAKYVLTIGEEELTKNVVNVKNMATGEQQPLDLNQVMSGFMQIINK